MAAPTERFYFGDFRLWQEGKDHNASPSRGLVQEFQGVDRESALVISASPNMALDLVVRTVGTPNPASTTRRGLRAILDAMNLALVARSARSDPVTWIEDTTKSKTVGSYAAPQVTSALHGYSNGDVVLIRRLGLGLWTLGTVSNVAANTFDVTAVTGGQVHAIAAADEIHLVEGYWVGMVLTGPASPSPAAEQDYYAPELVFTFRGSGTWSYSRTAAAVGS